ncbi:acyl-peptide hydrolase [Streptomyces purpurascens]
MAIAGVAAATVRTAPYGTWTSPITAAEVAAAGTRVEWVGFVGEHGGRPSSGLRRAAAWHWSAGPRTAPSPICSAPAGACAPGSSSTADAPGSPSARTPPPGSSSRTAATSASTAACRAPTRCRSARSPSCPPGSVTPTSRGSAKRCGACARPCFDPAGTEVRRAPAALPLDGRAAGDPGAVRVLGAGHHLMTGPKVSPDGRQVAWIGWNHPDMPWETTDLMCAPVRPDGTLGPARRIAGGPGVSVGQVEWAPTGPGCSTR